MSRTRWYVVAVLAAATLTVVLLDVTGVIFEPAAPPAPVLTVDAPPVTPADPALAPAGSGEPADARRLVRAVKKALDDDALGTRVHAYVGAVDGSVLLSDDASTASTPASTLKLLTALAVLRQLGAETTLTTRVVAGTSADGLVLVGGGDASLVTDRPGRGERPAASLQVLASRTATALRADGVTRVTLGYDSTLFTGPAVAPSWEDTYVSSGVIAPVTALMTDQGLVDPASGSYARETDPARAAAERFAALLSDHGIRVRGPVAPATAADSAPAVAEVESPSAGTLVERMLTDSDNQLAESLGRLAALAAGEPASFTGAAAVLLDAGAEEGADLSAATAYDASGLSRDDRVPPQALATVLGASVSDPTLRPLTDGLPVAALTGTLADRFLTPPSDVGAGTVWGKTGTLSGVTAEAGLALACDGTVVVYAFLADRVPWDTESARTALDDAAAALTTCRD